MLPVSCKAKVVPWMRPGFFRGFYKLLWFMIILSGIYLAVRCYTVLGGAQRDGSFEKLFDRMAGRVLRILAPLM